MLEPCGCPEEDRGKTCNDNNYDRYGHEYKPGRGKELIRTDFFWAPCSPNDSIVVTWRNKSEPCWVQRWTPQCCIPEVHDDPAKCDCIVLYSCDLWQRLEWCDSDPVFTDDEEPFIRLVRPGQEPPNRDDQFKLYREHVYSKIIHIGSKSRISCPRKLRILRESRMGKLKICRKVQGEDRPRIIKPNKNIHVNDFSWADMFEAPYI